MNKTNKKGSGKAGAHTTWTITGILIMVFLAAAFGSDQIDELPSEESCAQEGMFLLRNSTDWECTNHTPYEVGNPFDQWLNTTNAAFFNQTLTLVDNDKDFKARVYSNDDLSVFTAEDTSIPITQYADLKVDSRGKIWINNGNSTPMKICDPQSNCWTLTQLYEGKYWENASGIIKTTEKTEISNKLNVTTNISTPKLCLNGDCQTTWPTGGSTSLWWNNSGIITSNQSAAATNFYSLDVEDNTFFENNGEGNILSGNVDCFAGACAAIPVFKGNYTVDGNYNIISFLASTSAGKKLYVTGSHNIYSGISTTGDSLITGSYNVGSGDDNVIDADYTIVSGSTNKAYSGCDKSIVSGLQQTCSTGAAYSLMAGAQSTNAKSYCTNSGWKNVCNATFGSVTMGNNLNIQGKELTAIGRLITTPNNLQYSTGLGSNYVMNKNSTLFLGVENIGVEVNQTGITINHNTTINAYASYKTPLGGFWSDDDETGVVTINLPNANTLYNFTNLNKSNVNVGDNIYFTISEGIGTINFTNVGEGIYNVYVGMSFSSDKVGTYHCGIYKNWNEKQEISFERKISSVNSIGDAGKTGYINISNNNFINIQCKTDVATNPTITANHFNFNFERVST